MTRHDCITVDTLKIYSLSEQIAKKTQTIIAPPLFYGVCVTLKDRIGTLFGVKMKTYYNYIKEIFEGFYFMGFRRIFCLSGHYEGEQIRMIQKAVKKCLSTHKDLVIELNIEPDFSKIFPKTSLASDLMMDPKYYEGDHAGVYETSLMQYLYPELVDNNRLEENLHIVNKYYVDPIHSSPEFGKHLADLIVNEGSKLVENHKTQFQKTK